MVNVNEWKMKHMKDEFGGIVFTIKAVVGVEMMNQQPNSGSIIAGVSIHGVESIDHCGMNI